MSGTGTSRLTALLSRAPGQPDGDPACGIEIELPLDALGQISSAGPWRVRRFWARREAWYGELLQTDAGWAIRGTNGDDGQVWKLQARTLRPGDYLTLIRPTDDELVFRVVNVEPPD